MASLMENLFEVLAQECTAYEDLLRLAREKTAVVIRNDVEALNRITEDEQDRSSLITNLDRKREVVMKDVATVLNRDVANFKLSDLITAMAARPAEAKKLKELHDKLILTATELQRVNAQNRELIASQMEIVQFELNLLQATKSAPETANYSRGGYSAGDTMGVVKGGFDAKQ